MSFFSMKPTFNVGFTEKNYIHSTAIKLPTCSPKIFAQTCKSLLYGFSNFKYFLNQCKYKKTCFFESGP